MDNETPNKQSEEKAAYTKQPDEVFAFISYKSEDEKGALEVKRLLEQSGAGRLKLFVSKLIPFGGNWRKEISEGLLEADWLFLLFTRPTANWDWCLFEAGFFSALIEKEGDKGYRRLICLHGEHETAPGPLEHLQNVKAVHGNVEDLLRQLLGDPPRPGVRPLNEPTARDADALKALASPICEAVGPPPEVQVESYYHTHYLDLQFDGSELQELENSGKIPGSAKVKADGRSLIIFDRTRQKDPWTWTQLAEKWKDSGDPAWVEELGRAMQAATQGKVISPISTTGDSLAGGSYRPVVDRRDIAPDGSVRFHIIFTERPPEDDPRPSGDLGTIITVLTMARMFRWGVVEKYRNEMARLIATNASDQEMADCLDSLNSASSRMEIEAARGQLLVPEHITPAFPGDEDKITGMFNDWKILRQALAQAIGAKDIGQVKRILEEIRRMNKDFMVLAARRYHELLEAMI